MSISINEYKMNIINFYIEYILIEIYYIWSVYWFNKKNYLLVD